MIQTQVIQTAVWLLKFNKTQSLIQIYEAKSTTTDKSWFKQDFKLQVEISPTYRTRAIITRGLYTFYPLFEVQKRFFKGLFS